MWATSLRQRALASQSLMTYNMLRYNNPLVAVQAASFAKYTRSKPHLNVGTIGKCQRFQSPEPYLGSLDTPQSSGSLRLKFLIITLIIAFCLRSLFCNYRKLTVLF